MKPRRSTLILLAIATALFAFRALHRKTNIGFHGISVSLVHNCSDNDALQMLGDDRQIVVTTKPDGSSLINETPFTSSTIGPELAKIFNSRSIKVIWFIADPRLTYGQAVQSLTNLHSDGSNFIVALPTTSQGTAANLPVPIRGSGLPHFQAQCPYGL